MRCSKSVAESAVQISRYLQNRHLEDTVIATNVSWNGIGRFLKRIENDTLGIKRVAEELCTGTNRTSGDGVSAAA